MASYADPSTSATYDQPYFDSMRRGYLESAAALSREPRPIPVQKVAGLDPYSMRARELAGGLGGFTPYLQQGSQMAQQGFGTQQQGRAALGGAQGMYGQGANMMGQAAGMYAPGAAQQFYNPYEDQVVQSTIEQMNQQNAQQGQGDRARAVSSGAFGGSRGRLMEQEREKSFGRGLTQAVGGIRQQGYNQAQQAAQAAGQGLGTLGSQFGQLGQGITSMAGQYNQLGQGMGQMGSNMANMGMTGQKGLMNQIGAFDKFGQQGRGIQNEMFGAQYDAANKMAQEPWQRMTQWKNMMSGMAPPQATTTYGTQGGGGVFDLMKMFGMMG